MVTAPLLQWIFTVVFSAITVYYGWRAATGWRRPLAAAGYVLHALMAAVMVAMTWPWWRMLPWWPQLLLFSFATLWFLVLAVLQATGSLTREAVGGHTPWYQLVHFVMMGAMAWMVVAMPPADPHATGHGEGMQMGMPPFVEGVGIAVTAALVLAAVVEIILGIRALIRPSVTHGHHKVETWAMVAMMLGMAWMWRAMLVM